MRLSKSWKEEAIFQIVKNKCKDKELDIDSKMSDFAISYLNKNNEPYIDQIKKLPKEYFHITEYVYVKYGDSYYEREGVSIPETIITLNVKTENIIVKGKDKAEFIKLVKEKNDLKKYKDDLRRELYTVIIPCTTKKMLLKVLPEIENYVTLPNTVYPIAVQTDKLKNMLIENL